MTRVEATNKMRSSRDEDEWIANIKKCKDALGPKYYDWWENEIVKKAVLLETRKRFQW